MALPIAAIIEGISTLANAVGLYVTKKKTDQTEEKRKDLGKDVSDLQAALHKQTAFIDGLTSQVQALAVLVQKQEASISQLKTFIVLLAGAAIFLFVAVVWIEFHL